MNLSQEEEDEMAKRKDLDDDTEAEEVRNRMDHLAEELNLLFTWVERDYHIQSEVNSIRNHFNVMRTNFFGMWGQKSRFKTERDAARAEVQAYKLGAALHDAARRKDVNVSDLDSDTIKAIIKVVTK